MTEPQYQQFRYNNLIEEVCVRTAPISTSNGNLSYCVTLQDIQQVFPGALRFKLDGHPVPFLADHNGTWIEPLRIASYPGMILDVFAEVSQSSSGNSESNSSSNAVVYLPTSREAENVVPQNPPLPISNLVQAHNPSLTDDIKEIKVLLQGEIKVLLQEGIKLHHQTLDRLAILQQKADAILVQTFELHEYPIPRLFIILPVDNTNWDPMNILRNKVRLHFLCECEDRSEKASKNSQKNKTHLARHEGYEIRNSTEFFQKYGKYMIILLQGLKLGMGTSPGSSLTPASNLIDAGIKYSIDYLDELTKENPALNDFNTMDDYEGLEGADLRRLSTFLQTNDENRQLGNLYRTTTERGHVKWVCVDHYRSTYKEKEQKSFEDVVAMNGGKYDSQLGKVVIELKSRITAREFFEALTKAKHIYELEITFSKDWDWTRTDLEALKNALSVSSVSILRLDLGESQGSIVRKLLSTRHEKLVGIIELNNMKTIHVVLPPEAKHLSNLQSVKSSHLHKLSIGMRPRRMRASEFPPLINSLEALATLDLASNSIGNKEALALSKVLKTNTSLTNLDLSYNSIGDEGALALSEALKTNSSLANLNLMSNSIGDEGALALSEALKTNSSLSILDLQSNSIGKKGGLALMDTLNSGTALSTLGALVLAEVLKTNSSLTDLDLERNSIGKEGALALSEALKTNSSLTNLNLESNSIGKEGALALSEALKTNTSLTILNLERNSIGKEGALALSEALKTNSSLTILNLESNSIGKEGALALSEALKTNSSLTNLDLSYNSIGEEGALALSEALKTNTSLTHLNLEYNSIGNEGALALSEALKTNASLTHLNLERNSIGKEGALALSEALKTNSSLTNLNLYGNSIGKEGALALSEALKTNTSLTDLDLYGNSIGEEGALALSEVLKKNRALKVSV
ncbi:hypothetical protein BCR41DRAFT_425118 [Lobosporangium transversale]|uniref:RNI-like protein n=1 Tax=Lobosporangium transversale TaxID=64571 RepID=A0A1Y2GBY0_9FUNG|nr:hypothetical protein BCR41DRAFT_425118 [Lobosporangium transversale]ORZ06595.1 hypothetical protein BCR41DRAFT_425118 [Lobosporangium transversale]|eukprot:XP_021877638.1 hypothetical protein BCR41DRAFT_425118 [Lobosporangium transversale]